jgi:hypothetical protein
MWKREKWVGWTRGSLFRFQMASYSLFSALLLKRTHRALVKCSALYREYGAIWEKWFCLAMASTDWPVMIHCMIFIAVLICLSLRELTVAYECRRRSINILFFVYQCLLSLTPHNTHVLWIVYYIAKLHQFSCYFQFADWEWSCYA